MTPGEAIDAIDIAAVLITEILADPKLRTSADERVDDGISMTDRLECFLREPAVKERTAQWTS